MENSTRNQDPVATNPAGDVIEINPEKDDPIATDWTSVTPGMEVMLPPMFCINTENEDTDNQAMESDPADERYIGTDDNNSVMIKTEPEDSLGEPEVDAASTATPLEPPRQRPVPIAPHPGPTPVFLPVRMITEPLPRKLPAFKVRIEEPPPEDDDLDGKTSKSSTRLPLDFPPPLKIHIEQASPPNNKLGRLLFCSDCHYQTSCSTNYRRHIRKHTNEFQCQVCGHRFASNYRLRDHMKNKHKGNRLWFFLQLYILMKMWVD